MIIQVEHFNRVGLDISLKVKVIESGEDYEA